MNIPLVTNAVSLFGGAISSWLEIRRIKQEGAVAVEKAKQELLLKRAASQEDYDTEAVKQMSDSWKDEFLVLVFTVILLGNFMPVVQDYVITGWQYLAKAPDWFTYSYMGMVAASFGSRWLLQSKYVKELTHH